MHGFWNNCRLKLALQLHECHSFQGKKICIDSREVQEGDVFVGLLGNKCDGGTFAEQALSNGAAVCIINNNLGISGRSIVTVQSTQEALTRMASYRRAHDLAGVKVVGITGSAGKTSTKEMVKIILSSCGKIYATAGNQNNHIGLPLTICNAPEDADFIVLEMGMSCAGEIAELSRIAKPDIAFITSIAPAHLEFFRSVDDIADAKLEIFEGMLPGSYAVLDVGGEYYHKMKTRARAKGLNIINIAQQNFTHVADPAQSSMIESQKNETAQSKDNEISLQLLDITIKNNKTNIMVRDHDKVIKYYFPVIIGKHLVANSVAALAIVQALGQKDLAKIANRFAGFTPLQGRGSIQALRHDILLIDDSYNANPASVKAALQTLKTHKTEKNRVIAILGDMLELGANAINLHEALKDDASEIDFLFTVGNLMRNLHAVLPGSFHIDDVADVSAVVLNILQPRDVVLVKGSLSTNMLKVVTDIYKALS